MPCFTFYIFNRKGVCQYYHEWQVGIGGWLVLFAGQAARRCGAAVAACVCAVRPSCLRAAQLYYRAKSHTTCSCVLPMPLQRLKPVRSGAGSQVRLVQ